MSDLHAGDRVHRGDLVGLKDMAVIITDGGYLLRKIVWNPEDPERYEWQIMGIEKFSKTKDLPAIYFPAELLHEGRDYEQQD